MELDRLATANKIYANLRSYKESKESLTYFTKDNDNVMMHIYINNYTAPFIVPEKFGKRIIDLLFDLLDDRIKELEQQFKEL